MTDARQLAGPCPCGRSNAKGQALALAACCGPVLSGHVVAGDAQTLMRSRYSAFVRGDSAYLLQSWHASSRPSTIELDSQVRWLGLEVRQCLDSGQDTAEVEFVARFRVAGKAVRQHERSRFVREDGRWWYLDGDAL